MNDPIPVAIFCYNRPRHLAAMLASYDACAGREHTKPFVFCDGAKDAAGMEATAAVQEVVREWATRSGAEVEISPVNRGLSASILHGVGKILGQHDRVIVLEDDLIFDPSFLTFHLDGLERYVRSENVYQISGHQWLDMPAFVPAFFAPFTTTWGWSTWRRAWQKLDVTAPGREHLETDTALRHRYDIQGRYPFSELLKGRFRGENDSWGILWYWTVFSQNGLVLYPPRCLVSNRGFDGSGTHCERRASAATSSQRRSSNRIRFPKRARPSRVLFEWMKRELYRQTQVGVG